MLIPYTWFCRWLGWHQYAVLSLSELLEPSGYRLMMCCKHCGLVTTLWIPDDGLTKPVPAPLVERWEDVTGECEMQNGGVLHRTNYASWDNGDDYRFVRVSGHEDREGFVLAVERRVKS